MPISSSRRLRCPSVGASAAAAIEEHIMELADTLSAVIIRQFPDRFSA